MPTRCCMILLDIYSGKVKLACLVICRRTTLLISTVTELFFLIMWTCSSDQHSDDITKIPDVSTSLSHLLFLSKDNIWVVELYTYVWIFCRWNTQGMLDIFCVWYQLLNIGQLILHEHNSLHGVLTVYLFY